MLPTITLNPAPPDGFCGLDAEKPVRIYNRNLPHWRQDGATYFATFNLADALPSPKKEQLKSMRRQWERRNPTPRDEQTWARYAKAVFRTVEKWMNAGHGTCWFRNEDYATELKHAILLFHQKRYEIGCYVIMGNHCHLIIRPFESIDLQEELGSTKSITARFVNKREGPAGSLWQQQSHDRIIRDEEHLYRVVQYIGSNPQRASINQKHWHRWINPNGGRREGISKVAWPSGRVPPKHLSQRSSHEPRAHAT